MWINDETQSHIKEVISMRTVIGLKNRDLFMENSTISVTKLKVGYVGSVVLCLEYM